jgi:threonyl-tRNA synthetase
MTFPPIISIEDLKSINYFEDHPTQAVFLSAIPTPAQRPQDNTAAQTKNLSYALNPAACYHAYISQRNQIIKDTVRIATQTRCYRNQPPYSISGRMFSFTQRKLVFIGTSEKIRSVLKEVEKLVIDLGTQLGLNLQMQPSNAPVFSDDPKLGKIKALFLADKEFIYKDVPALGHTNFHRNYFCKRLNIQMSNGSYAFAGCLGVIPEYWLLSLKNRYSNNENEIITKLNQYLKIKL